MSDLSRTYLKDEINPPAQYWRNRKVKTLWLIEVIKEVDAGTRTSNTEHTETKGFRTGLSMRWLSERRRQRINTATERTITGKHNWMAWSLAGPFGTEKLKVTCRAFYLSIFFVSEIRLFVLFFGFHIHAIRLSYPRFIFTFYSVTYFA